MIILDLIGALISIALGLVLIVYFSSAWRRDQRMDRHLKELEDELESTEPEWGDHHFTSVADRVDLDSDKVIDFKTERERRQR